MSDPDLCGAVLDGRYRVIERIAEGAMGAVYRGERLGLGRAVAIKILHDALPDELASRERFEREAKLMARLDHPHCVAVIDFGLHEDKPYLVMELVRGTSLLELLAASGPLAPARAAELMRQVLSGLQHAHELGIVHRDIKPANIMLAEKAGLGEQVRILDFGLALPQAESAKLTAGIVVGTPNYMAPEQIKGASVDGRVDLYACGVTLFELLTGQKPFLGRDPLAVVRKHLHDAPPRLSDIRTGVAFGELEAVVARALAKSPDERYANAEDMAAALEHAVAASAHPAAPSAPAPDPAAPRAPLEVPPTRMHVARRATPRRILLGGAGVGVVLICIVAATHGSEEHPSPPPAAPVAAPLDAASDPAAPILAQVNELADHGDTEGALGVIVPARRLYPDDAALAFVEGKLYFGKYWWHDGLKALRDAIRLDPGYRKDPELIKLALRAFLTTPDPEPELQELIDKDIGGPARPFLEDAAKTNPNAMLRARVAAELKHVP